MSGWDHRLMFERYLYDYLRKNNMHRTADILMREANILLDPTVPPAIDVPDGFLHEWWLVFYDHYRSQHPRDHICGERSTMMQIMGARQQIDPAPSRQYAMNTQTISQLLTESISWFNTGVNAMGSRSLLIGAVQVPEGMSLSLHQENIFSSMSRANLPGNLGNITGQDLGCSVLAASRKADSSLEEEDELIPPPLGFEHKSFNSIWLTEKNRKELKGESQLTLMSGAKSINTSDSVHGNGSVLGDADTTSDASLTKNKSDDFVRSSSRHTNGDKDNADADTTSDDSLMKYKLCDGNVKSSSPHAKANKDNADASLMKYESFDDNAKSSSLHLNGNKDNAGSSSSKLPGSARTPDDLQVHLIVESKKRGVNQ